MFSLLEQKFWHFLGDFSPRLHDILFKRRQILVFLVAGGLALVADVFTLYVCKSVLGMTLIPAVAVAFLAGFLTSFLLQKFWTFEDVSVDRVHTQASLFFAVAVINFFLTEILMHFSVDVFRVQYLIAKIFISGGLAFFTFFAYRIFIFKRSV